MTEPPAITARMQGEALSVAIHSANGIAAVTHPDGGMVTFWTIAGRKLLKVIDLPSPRGVELTVDQQYFLVSYGLEANVVQVSVDDLEIDKASTIFKSYITGSHIYNWSRAMSELYYPA
ncbi:DUF1513 domain-containing protein [Oceanicoccus sp. KOV_DT_Chl]|uniref:DUF1513 domain-containing protein n=1 Tax=Oceanicoccus sp. KOV_DT_Chl TaxID=1904639 RepID=UPI000C7DEA8E